MIKKTWLHGFYQWLVELVTIITGFGRFSEAPLSVFIVQIIEKQKLLYSSQLPAQIGNRPNSRKKSEYNMNCSKRGG
ncbi:MAG: hypothetical protein V3U62_04890 [Sedimenticolaceae bacterium]